MARSSGTVQRSNRDSGMDFQMLVPGAFYQGVYPGGITCATTGIHIPGPKAVLDGSTRREVVSLESLPDPVQVPHSKVMIEVSEGGKTRREVTADFNASDEQPVHELFQNALATGLIRMVPDSEVREKYPDAWAKREEDLTFRLGNAAKVKPMIEMLHEAEDEGRFVKHAAAVKDEEAARKSDLDKPRGATKPPPPPPPK